jgi:hypothetical protein
MDGTDSTPPTEAGTERGNEEVGKRMGQRGCSDLSGGALFGVKKVRGSASPVGGRADLFLAGQNRRMSKDYERLAVTSEAFGYVAMSRLMVRRLARS